MCWPWPCLGGTGAPFEADKLPHGRPRISAEPQLLIFILTLLAYTRSGPE
jgi:hypothetical protein